MRRVGYVLDKRDLRKLQIETWVCSRRVPEEILLWSDRRR